MTIPELLARARALGERFADQPEAARRLSDSVIQPLSDVTQEGAPASPSDGDELWELAKDLTRLSAQPGVPVQVYEAAAALQDLACAGPDSGARLEELAALQAGLPCRIQVMTDGPYLVINAERLTDYLGQPIPVRPLMALCRCGASAAKPFCDGSHRRIGFTDGKDPNRVPDRLDAYPGQPITITDNRGTCAHSGFCTGRLPTAFRADREPFVAPRGGRMDEVVLAARDCPSGALGYTIDGKRPPERDRPAAIEVSKDGPYRVTGGIPIVDHHGDPEPQNQGASAEHYSLCRCGHSRNKPFCSGMHWYVNFHDPEPDPDRTPSLFEWAGGLPALTRMTRMFYERHIPADPLLAPLFANMEPDHPERVAAWLGEVFGGPKAYTDTYGGYGRMVSQHLNKGITEEHRARWVQLIVRSMDDAELPADPEFRAAFVAYVEWGSRLAMENSQPGARPPQHMPVPRWWWVCEATPGARISALAPVEEQPAVALPAPDEPLSFEAHIKPLFRAQDRRSMSFAFDLWSHEDVSRHAEAILDRLREGTMPCDGAWPQEWIDAFARWVKTGKPE
ncbi:CDGSH iron-sulfur domain-containing protein [Nonomuraea sp. NPDC003707]